ncbi:hypothetical protein [Trinickia violacea]|nr:hypothetical protein [Trinickia violacea]
MKRLLAIAALFVGGLAAEIAHPVQCTLITASSIRVKRRKV